MEEKHRMAAGNLFIAFLAIAEVPCSIQLCWLLLSQYTDTGERAKPEDQLLLEVMTCDVMKGHGNCSIYFLCRLFFKKGKEKKKIGNLEKSKVRTHSVSHYFPTESKKIGHNFLPLTFYTMNPHYLKLEQI